MIEIGKDSHNEIATNNRILLFAPYFGSLPDHFPLWLRSCEYNPTIDWVVFVDRMPDVTVPANVKMIEMKFQDFCAIISNRMEMPVAIYDAYKLCDFKPAYGYIFDDLVKEYDYWGNCDIDLIFGDIRKFITDDILQRHEKILFCGHLTIYKNTPVINQLFMYQNELVDYKKVFSDPECCFFDEHGGMDLIAKAARVKQYSNIVYADISHKYNKLTLTELHNHEHQVFYWENGEVFREYLDDRYKTARKDSFAYIHFQKRKMIMEDNTLDAASFFITPDGFRVKTIMNLSMADFSRYNQKRLKLLDFYWYNSKRVKNKLKRIQNSFGYKRVVKNE